MYIICEASVLYKTSILVLCNTEPSYMDLGPLDCTILNATHVFKVTIEYKVFTVLLLNVDISFSVFN